PPLSPRFCPLISPPPHMTSLFPSPTLFRSHRVRRHSGFLLGFADRGVPRRLGAPHGTAGQRPRAALMHPARSVLQQHAALRIAQQQPRGAVPAPVPLAARTPDEAVAVIHSAVFALSTRPVLRSPPPWPAAPRRRWRRRHPAAPCGSWPAA